MQGFFILLTNSIKPTEYQGTIFALEKFYTDFICINISSLQKCVEHFSKFHVISSIKYFALNSVFLGSASSALLILIMLIVECIA
jgi:hypothetical protein